MPRRHLTACIAFGFMLPPAVLAQTAYYRHVVFDNSQQADSYWNSTAQACPHPAAAGTPRFIWSISPTAIPS